MKKEQAIKHLQNKHLLVDSGVASRLFMYPDSFSELYEIISESSCRLCINNAIQIELARFGKNKLEKDKIDDFLLKNLFLLPITNEIYEIAKEMDPIYGYCSSIKDRKQVSIPDLINAAFIKKYGDNLLLITLDHQDFPREFFERVFYRAEAIGDHFIVWGIYRFDLKSYEKLKEKYQKNAIPDKKENRK